MILGNIPFKIQAIIFIVAFFLLVTPLTNFAYFLFFLYRKSHFKKIAATFDLSYKNPGFKYLPLFTAKSLVFDVIFIEGALNGNSIQIYDRYHSSPLFPESFGWDQKTFIVHNGVVINDEVNFPWRGRTISTKKISRILQKLMNETP